MRNITLSSAGNKPLKEQILNLTNLTDSCYIIASPPGEPTLLKVISKRGVTLMSLFLNATPQSRLYFSRE